MYGTYAWLVMSALGHKRTCRAEIAMSALPLKADIRRRHRDVSFGPQADSCTATKESLFDHLGSAGQHHGRDRDPHGLCRLLTDDQLELVRLDDG
jgi:hypothetical protein